MRSILRPIDKDLSKEVWEGEQPPQKQSEISYVLQMRDKLSQMSSMSHNNLEKAQAVQKSWYNWVSKKRTFAPGQEVLLLLPTRESSLLAKWQGPYKVTREMGPVTYEVAMPE